jgi:hypothetical protein
MKGDMITKQEEPVTSKKNDESTERKQGRKTGN